jgi:branched-chain amino acid aminotransferase
MNGATLPAVWVNGRRHAPDAPHVSSRDRGFTLADGVFETMRVAEGTVFRLDRHLARLAHGMDVLGIGAPRELRAWVDEGLAGARGEAAMRVTVTRGPGSGGIAPSRDAFPTVVVALNPMPAFGPEIYDRGLAAHVASGRINEHSMTAGLKTLAYTDAVAALIEASRAGAEEALFLNTSSQCAEATSSNLFIVAGDALVTPPLTCGVLPGITREAVLELAGAAGLAAAERAFGLEDLCAADEAFLTSSLRGIAPLVRVGSRAIGSGRPGAVTRRIADAYRAIVEDECRRHAAAGLDRDR